MIKNFDYWNNLHRQDALEEFNFDTYGLLWLKVKSIARVELFKEFQSFSGIKLSSKKTR